MKYEYWFASVKNVKDSVKILLRETYKTAGNIYYIEEKEFRENPSLPDTDLDAILESRKSWNLEAEYETLVRGNIRLIVHGMKDYPHRLYHIFQPPYALYVKGNMPGEQAPAVAIVGARKCTPYGEKNAMVFAGKLSSCGAEIISGMALGIDGASQRAALNAGGRTFAVLGSGVDVCYPRNHIGLYMDILECGGGIISEQPPGMQPLNWTFPRRNRIISGLSDVVLVMEAKEKSGSLITADMAMEQGKDVYALPGNISNVLSQGCNRLIKQGAGILLSPEELVEDLKISCGICLQNSYENVGPNIGQKEIMLESTEKLVYSCLDFDSKNVEALVRGSGLSPQEVAAVLVSLELKGLIREISKNYYVKS